jgi:hypothetical protein
MPENLHLIQEIECTLSLGSGEDFLASPSFPPQAFKSGTKNIIINKIFLKNILNMNFRIKLAVL